MEELDGEPGVEGQLVELDLRDVADWVDISDVAGRVADHACTADSTAGAVVEVSVRLCNTADA
jgi:hypothetical protein